MEYLRSFAALSAALLFVVSPLTAQDNWGRGGVEFNVSYGVMNGIGDEYVGLDPVALEVDNNHFFTGRLGYVLKAGLGVEGFFGYMSNDLQTTGVVPSDVTFLNYGGDLVWNLQPESALQIFFMGGAGQQQIDVDPVDGADEDSESYFAWNYGAGVKMFLSRHLAFRVDWRNYIADTGPEEIRARLNPGVALDLDEGLANTEWTAGLSIFMGGPADEDGDGVTDSNDLCPGTPSGVAVDGDGCPFDDDGDVVYNYMDACPDTPAGAVVDATGCPMDADGDGVFDGIDQCPDTPAGREVDADGCAEFQAALAEGRLVFSGIEFEFNSSDLKDESLEFLDRVAAAILSEIANQPGISIEVRGHTDSVGSESYNQGLSERRAAAVRDYVVSVEPSIADAITSAGYGESQPIADNDTDEGRTQNRRIEFVVSLP